MKRDLEEQKRDIETATLLNMHKSFIESLQVLSQMNSAINTTDAICRPEETSIKAEEEEDDDEETNMEEEIDLDWQIKKYWCIIVAWLQWSLINNLSSYNFTQFYIYMALTRAVNKENYLTQQSVLAF